MANDQTEGEQQPPFLLFNWHFVGKIALVVAAISCLAAVLVLHFITGSSGQNHAEVIRYFSQSRQGVGQVLLAVGFILISFASIITWLIALYTSFYIAGPLFRFARNFETLSKQGPVALPPIRKTDRLKNEEQQIKLSVDRLQKHYGQMRSAIDEAIAKLDTQPSVWVAELKNIDREASL